MAKNDFALGAPEYPIHEPMEAPAMLTPGSSAFHLPRSLLNPDNGKVYGFRTYRCGGVEDRDAYDLSISQGWIPEKSSEIQEFQNAHHLDVFSDSQDKLARVRGQVIMYQTQETKQYWDTQNENLLNGYRDTVKRYRKFSEDDMAGPEAHRGYGNW